MDLMGGQRTAGAAAIVESHGNECSCSACEAHRVFHLQLRSEAPSGPRSRTGRPGTDATRRQRRDGWNNEIDTPLSGWSLQEEGGGSESSTRSRVSVPVVSASRPQRWTAAPIRPDWNTDCGPLSAPPVPVRSPPVASLQGDAVRAGGSVEATLLQPGALDQTLLPSHSAVGAAEASTQNELHGPGPPPSPHSDLDRTVLPIHGASSSTQAEQDAELDRTWLPSGPPAPRTEDAAAEASLLGMSLDGHSTLVAIPFFPR
ncbi:unnamed protein product [Polarella glacialis]|uniref:Uncharacterized protein n=1 Tax=Polarella glacialis TaxID=89957 RepID=A0A813EVJ1_POLGL|nr:unnamed protein product [Polarella glacialis]